MTSTSSSQGDRGSRGVRVPTAPEWLIGSETPGQQEGSWAASGSDEAAVPPILGVLQHQLQLSPDPLPGHSSRAFASILATH